MRRQHQREFTGLRDINNKGIHEGDILESLFVHYYGKGTKDEYVSKNLTRIVVAFKYGGFGIVRYKWKEGGYLIHNKNGEFCKNLHSWLRSSKLTGNGGYGFKIIGNIYDNKDIFDELKN